MISKLLSKASLQCSYILPFVLHFSQLAVVLHLQNFHTHLVTNRMTTPHGYSVAFFEDRALERSFSTVLSVICRTTGKS